MNELDYQAKGTLRPGRSWPMWVWVAAYTLAFVCLAVPLLWFGLLALLWRSSLPD